MEEMEARPPIVS
jgi:hypothetical protein